MNRSGSSVMHPLFSLLVVLRKEKKTFLAVILLVVAIVHIFPQILCDREMRKEDGDLIKSRSVLIVERRDYTRATRY